MPDIEYKPGTGFYDSKTKASLNITPELLKSYSEEIAKAYKGRASGITVCVAVVQTEGTQLLVYTVSNNRTDPKLREMADKLGITKWEHPPRTKGRGLVGSPGDAEQILFEAADVNGDYKVLAAAPSRKACPDCKVVLKERGVFYIDDVKPVAKPTPVVKPKPGKPSAPKVKPAAPAPSKPSITDTRGTTAGKPPASSRAVPKPSPDSKAVSRGTSAKTIISRAGKIAKVRSAVTKISTTLRNIAPSVAKIFNFYLTFDKIYSAFDTVKSAVSQFANGPTLTPDEQIARSVEGEAYKINKESNNVLDNILNDDFFTDFESALESTETIEVLSLGGVLVDIKNFPNTVIPQLKSLNIQLNAKIKAMDVAYKYIHWLLTDKEGFATLVTTAGILTLGDGISTITAEAFKIHESLDLMRTSLRNAFEQNKETLFVLEDISQNVETLDKLHAARVKYLADNDKFTGPGWGVDEE